MWVKKHFQTIRRFHEYPICLLTPLDHSSLKIVAGACAERDAMTRDIKKKSVEEMGSKQALGSCKKIDGYFSIIPVLSW